LRALDRIHEKLAFTATHTVVIEFGVQINDPFFIWNDQKTTAVTVKQLMQLVESKGT